MLKKSSKHILIIGANGFIAKELIQSLQKKTYKISGTYNKHKNSNQSFENYFQYTIGNKLPELKQNFSAVIYLAHDFKAEAEQNVIQGIKELYFYLKNTLDIPKHIYIGSYSSAANSLSAYGRSKYELEQFFIKQNETVIRPGLVLGKGGLFARIIKAVQKNYFVPLIGSGNGKVPIIGINELCNAITKLIDMDDKGEYNLFYTKFISLKEIVAAVAKNLNKRRIMIPIPANFLLVILYIIELINLPFPISSENIKGFLSNQTASNKYQADPNLIDQTINVNMILTQYINSCSDEV